MNSAFIASMLPSDWHHPRADARIDFHFDKSLPDEYSAIVKCVLAEVQSILGGAFPCHVVATHTHRKPASPSAIAAVSEVSHLVGGKLLGMWRLLYDGGGVEWQANHLAPAV